ncbi:S1 family peptidase [Psychromicrobium sp. YIM B11713]|uniref:S1 family peptidase n=1 Tax=Psychromicrobium sp. YIM B11713 TaxID=3145233 RepID=UPI00374F3238
MKITKILTATALVGLLAAGGLSTASQAQAIQPAPEIVGGSVANFSSVPFATQLYLNGQFNCSSSLISSTWVLTAKHCVDGTVSVRVGSGTLGQGTLISSKRVVTWSSGDLALVELSQPYNTTFASLGATNPSRNTTGNIYGWGRETPTGPAAPNLKTARVKVVGLSTDAYGGVAIAHNGIDGQAWKGDSGGPLVINGKVVGVASTSGSGGTDTQGRSNYTSVPNGASWIASISGVNAS